MNHKGIKLDIMAEFRPNRTQQKTTEKDYSGEQYTARLIPLPLGLGLFAFRYQGERHRVSVRSWEWARYDYLDHVHGADETRTGRRILSSTPKASHPFALGWDAWQTQRFWKRHGA